MPITYAGIGLEPPNGAQALVERWWHGHRIEEFEFEGYYGPPGLNQLPIPYPPSREAPRTGVLSWPTGASRWATCHLIATDSQVQQIRNAIGSSPTAQTLSLSDGTNKITTQMWLLPPRPIQQRGNGQDLYLITLVDDRWFWWQSGDSQIVSESTWSGQISALLTLLGVTATIDSVPAAYGTPNKARWNLGYKPIPPVLDAVCKTVGMRLVRNLDGSVNVSSYTTSATNDATNWSTYSGLVLAGGQLEASDIALSVPFEVTVIFNGATDDVSTVTLSSLSLTQYGSAVGVATWSGQIIADLPAGSSGESSYATQAATDYYLWALSITDCTMRGIVARPITGLDWCQEWFLPQNGEYVTRVIRTPFSDRNQYGSSQPSNAPQPVILTSYFSSTTGYSWTNLKINTTSQTYVTGTGSGNKLVFVDNDQTLQPGRMAIRFPDPTTPGQWMGQLWPMPLVKEVCPIFVSGVLTGIEVESWLSEPMAGKSDCVDNPNDCCDPDPVPLPTPPPIPSGTCASLLKCGGVVPGNLCLGLIDSSGILVAWIPLTPHTALFCGTSAPCWWGMWSTPSIIGGCTLGPPWIPSAGSANDSSYNAAVFCDTTQGGDMAVGFSPTGVPSDWPGAGVNVSSCSPFFGTGTFRGGAGGGITLTCINTNPLTTLLITDFILIEC